MLINFGHRCLVRCRAHSSLSTPSGMFTQQRNDRIIFGLWLYSSFFKAVWSVYKTLPIVSFLPAPMWARYIQLSISGFQTIRGLNQSAASLCSAFPFTPLSCPRRGFCCCISAFLLCVQEVREQTSECFDSCSPSPETNMRTEHRQRQRLMKQRRCC